MIPKGRENWLPEATTFASSYKSSLKIWNPTVMKYVEEQRLVGIKNAHALRLWNLDIATWCMNSFYIALSNWQTLHKWNVMKYDESKKISQASKAAITLRILWWLLTFLKFHPFHINYTYFLHCLHFGFWKIPYYTKIRLVGLYYWFN